MTYAIIFLMNKNLLFCPIFCLLLASCQTSSVSSVFSSDSTSQSLTYEDELRANSVSWGLGSNITTYVSNDRDYEWYVDQRTTGTYWDVNCGPTSVEMAGRWSNESFAYSAEDARASYHPTGGWWYDSDIQGALNQFAIPNTSSTISSSNDLTTLLDDGKILLVNPDMSKLTYQRNLAFRTERFYKDVTGHYLIVKGYVLVDEAAYFEVYDPWSVNAKYSDGVLKGKNRYYSMTSLTDSLLAWWPKIYAISSISSV